MDEKHQIDKEDIEKLEKILFNFEEEWEKSKKSLSQKWRKHFLICFVITVSAAMLVPILWWTSIVVIAYFAGSLFTLLRQNAKTCHQIMEHKKQIQLARLLRNFDSSPYSHK